MTLGFLLGILLQCPPCRERPEPRGDKRHAWFPGAGRRWVRVVSVGSCPFWGSGEATGMKFACESSDRG